MSILNYEVLNLSDITTCHLHINAAWFSLWVANLITSNVFHLNENQDEFVRDIIADIRCMQIQTRNLKTVF